MKRNSTKLLIISIICAIITVIFCFLAVKYMNYNPFFTTEGVVDEVNQMGSDNPGTGWYLLLAGGTALLTDFGIMIAYFIFVIVIPGFILFLIMASQCIARLVQIGNEQKWKNTTSKVFTYISVVLLILLSLELIFIISIVKNVLLIISLISSILCIVLFIKELIVIKKQTIEKTEEKTDSM